MLSSCIIYFTISFQKRDLRQGLLASAVTLCGRSPDGKGPPSAAPGLSYRTGQRLPSWLQQWGQWTWVRHPSSLLSGCVILDIRLFPVSGSFLICEIGIIRVPPSWGFTICHHVPVNCDLTCGLTQSLAQATPLTDGCLCLPPQLLRQVPQGVARPDSVILLRYRISAFGGKVQSR